MSTSGVGTSSGGHSERSRDGAASFAGEGGPPAAPAGEWHIITGEYPPQRGGVSAYSELVARGLVAEGAHVHVWCPGPGGEEKGGGGITVHRRAGGFSPGSLRGMGRELDLFPGPRRLLVQWVPHGFGYKAMNLAFCLWLLARARRSGDKVYLMAHEAHVAFGESLRTDIVAAVNRLMDIALLQAASRVWVGTPEWGARLAPYRLGRALEFEFLPVPSNILRVRDAHASALVRSSLTDEGEKLVGHFGTYGVGIAPLLDELLPDLLTGDDQLKVLLLGHGASAYRERYARRYPSGADRVLSPAGLNDEDLSLHLAACDLFVQPYPDGLTCRRGSAMAVVGHSVPLVSNVGRYTEALWSSSGAARVVPGSLGMAGIAEAAVSLLREPAELDRLTRASEELYRERFDIRHTVRAMIEAGTRQPAPTSR